MRKIKISNIKCFETVAKFMYLEMIVTNQNDIIDEIGSRYNLKNAYKHYFCYMTKDFSPKSMV
jgi:hypothetical protein